MTSPNAGPGWADRVAGVRVRDDVRRSAPSPERAAVVAAALGVGAALALARATHVDDLGVDGPDVLDVDAQLAAGLGPEVGEEHVGRFAELEQQLPTFGRPHVDAHAALAPVRELHHVRDTAGTGRDQAHGGQTTLGVAALGVLDLDDVGTPLGEDRSGDRHIRPRGHFDYPDAVHDSHNWFFPLTRVVIRSGVFVGAVRSSSPSWSPVLAVAVAVASRRCRRRGGRRPGSGPGENGRIDVAGHDGTHRAPVGDQVLPGDVRSGAAVEEEQRVGLLSGRGAATSGTGKLSMNSLPMCASKSGIIGVCVGPGLIELIRIPLSAQAYDAQSVHTIRASFEGE